MSAILISETVALKIDSHIVITSLFLCKTMKEKLEEPIKKTRLAKEIRPMLIVLISTRKPSE